MTIRNTLVCLSLAASAVPAAFAHDINVPEIGPVVHQRGGQSALTREQVRGELDHFRAHPVLADGTVALTGEAGDVPANQGAFADRQPNQPHTHAMGNSGVAQTAQAEQEAPMSVAERRAYREQYVN